MTDQPHRNWAGNRTYGAWRIERPRTLDELPGIVRGSRRVHALGSRHSFNGVADTSGTHVLLDHLAPTVEVDVDAHTARVSPWATYGHVGPLIEEHGLALAALASLPHISVGGACATATHGSGVRTRTLSAAVRAMTFVDGTGEVVEVSRDVDPDRFPGLVVHLGAIGIVTSLTLDLVESVPWHQREWRGLPGTTLLEHVEEIMAGADSVSVFTRWREPADTTILHKWTGDRDVPDELFGATAIDPEDATDTANSPNRTDATGAPGPWHERIPHFRLGFTPSAGEELQSEWFVDRADAADALAAVWSVGEQLDRALIVSELRTVAADDLWLSPALDRDVLTIHCTWVDDQEVVVPAIDVVEEALAPFDPFPHWGKLTHLDRAAAARRHARLDDVADLVAEHDPDGRCRNDLLDELLP